MKTVCITITGKVQGVFFRASTREKARSLNLRGYVKNQHDGSVYIEVSGDPMKLQKLIDWCRVGPEMAIVENVSVIELDQPSHEIEFEIVH
ncbi:acylphosphatase [Marinigracilibium pacificum]|uniref:Acylphosphatase n=1 Tax=Marinigracilibium pacificum TaxID=2729599 RepID=A0A848J5T1_9BACT|nr:acylphosphatase [Marinigracilibium pacificum]NMM49729.1 acylphosphatase [Marinigracilibium pacificum]